MSGRNVSRVVIVGCGIAGPALGMFLRRIGIDVVICERRPSEAVDEGLFLGVAPNGMNVLSELDVHRSIDTVSVPCDGFEFQNARAETIGTIDRQARCAAIRGSAADGPPQRPSSCADRRRACAWRRGAMWPHPRRYQSQ